MKTVIGYAFAYAGMAFILLDPNPLNWGVFSRAVCVAIPLVYPLRKLL